MKIYLLDDDRHILLLLKQIIEVRELGEICGMSTNPATAQDELLDLQPDLLLIDLLMPEMDGIAVTKSLKEKGLRSGVIMLSQVSSKEMIAKAYENGVEFFIQKPINAVEVEAVIKNVGEKQAIQETYEKIKGLFSEPKPSDIVKEKPGKGNEVVTNILRQLGIVGETGSRDILRITEYLLERGIYLGEVTLGEVCTALQESPKTMEQRVRRAAMNGLGHLANLGLEDFGNPTFEEYANTLYSFSQVRKEMDYIKGKSSERGNVKVRNFLNALVTYCQNEHL
ncbi:two-component system response regulator YcbB [Lachnospiraceae bacterium PF1-21]|uniref:Stage 0 sporulation protein A homolog n=1 Tax=Ohessyouella blattaphilus TaxID=2949333 RepID=A0ABT1ELF5_9FIRM|nr:response regulator [Ohessyouella blattaphilus]MCP1111535.1 response regulator [Ohessyouella blattaphilus]MCR8564929.1 response regulator [Ohessyouella blattaphilus]